MRSRALFVGFGLTLFALVTVSSETRADAVDEAYAAGGEAAVLARWPEAVTQYERARSLLAAPSAALDYDLGTAYAHTQELGPAVFHLRSALRLARSERVREAARRNLSVAMRRVALRAEVSGARVSNYQDWKSTARKLLQSEATGWMSLLAGIYLALFACLRAVASGVVQRFRAIAMTLVVICACSFVGLGTMRAAALHGAPEAVVVGQDVAVREGAGHHHAIAFHVQGGSIIRLKDSAPGWRHVRLDEGLEGWISERSLLFQMCVAACAPPCLCGEIYLAQVQETCLHTRKSHKDGLLQTDAGGKSFRTWQTVSEQSRFTFVLAVVAQKIRGSRQGPSSTVGRVYEGFLLSEPVVGRGMVLFRDPNGRRMVTTSVRRILGGSDDGVLYVETENSVYRLMMNAETAAAPSRSSAG